MIYSKVAIACLAVMCAAGCFPLSGARAADGDPATPGAAPPVLAVEPLVRLKDERVAACGVAFAGEVRSGRLAVEFTLNASEIGPVFRLTARYAGAAPVVDISLETEGGSTAGLLPRAQPTEQGWLTTEGPIPGLVGSELVQSLMVSGGRLVLGLAGPEGDVVEVELPKPFSHDVRAAYLACAGDLVVP